MSNLLLQEILQAKNNQYSKCQTDQSVQQRFRKNHPVNVAASCPIATVSGNSLGTAHHGRNNQQDIVQHSHQQHDNRKTQKDNVHDAVIIRRGKYFGYRTERELKTRTRLSHLFRHMIHFQHTLHAFLQVIRSTSFPQADIGLVAVISEPVVRSIISHLPDGRQGNEHIHLWQMGILGKSLKHPDYGHMKLGILFPRQCFPDNLFACHL